MRSCGMFMAGAVAFALMTTGAVAQERQGPPGHGAFFERLDADKDGKVALDDIPEQAPDKIKAMLRRADSDGDKKVTKEEISKVMRAMHAGRPGPSSPPDRAGQGRGGPPWAGSNYRGPQADRGSFRGFHGPPSSARPEGRPQGGPPSGGFMAMLDENEDGKIGKDEAVGRLKENFEKIDANKDGEIDRVEGRQAMMAVAKMRSQGRPGPGGPPWMGQRGFSGPKPPMMGHRGPGRGYQQMGHRGPGRGYQQMGHRGPGRGYQQMGHRGPGRGYQQMGHRGSGRGYQQMGHRGPMPPMMGRGQGPYPAYGTCPTMGPSMPEKMKAFMARRAASAKKPAGPAKPAEKKARPEKKKPAPKK